MTDPQDTITVHSSEEKEEVKKDNVRDTPRQVTASQQKYKYCLKDAVLEMRSKKTTFGSDSLILATQDLRHHRRYDMCNEYCRRGYRTTGIPDLRWRREKPAPPVPYYLSGSGVVGNRRRNFPSMDFARPPFEMSTNPTRRKYLQRSLTSSELMGPSYRRCLPVIPTEKSRKNSLYGSSKSVHSYDCVQPKSNPVAPTSKSDYENENQPEPCNNKAPVPQTQNSSTCSSSSDGSLNPKTSSTVSTLPMGSLKQNESSPRMKQTFGSQYSLTGSQCCQNCHFVHMTSCQKTMIPRWHSQSTVIFYSMIKYPVINLRGLVSIRADPEQPDFGSSNNFFH